MEPKNDLEKAFLDTVRNNNIDCYIGRDRTGNLIFAMKRIEIDSVFLEFKSKPYILYYGWGLALRSWQPFYIESTKDNTLCPVSIETFLASNLVPSLIKRTLLFNLDFLTKE